MAYKVDYKISVEGDLKKIDKSISRRILSKAEAVLSSNPHAGEPLKAEFQGLFKYRVGDYRVIYSKTSEGVLVLRIRHRKEVYR